MRVEHAVLLYDPSCSRGANSGYTKIPNTPCGKLCRLWGLCEVSPPLQRLSDIKHRFRYAKEYAGCIHYHGKQGAAKRAMGEQSAGLPTQST